MVSFNPLINPLRLAYCGVHPISFLAFLLSALSLNTSPFSGLTLDASFLTLSSILVILQTISYKSPIDISYPDPIFIVSPILFLDFAAKMNPLTVSFI